MEFLRFSALSFRFLSSIGRQSGASKQPRWWDVVVSPIRDAEGKPERLLAVSRDVTEHKRNEEALHKAHVQVARSEERWRSVQLMKTRDADAARAALEKCIQLRPDNAEGHYSLGLLFTRDAKRDLAIAEFERTIQCDRGHLGARLEEARIQTRNGNTSRALQLLNESVKLHPEAAEAHAELGAVLRTEGDYAKALPELEQAVRLKPQMAKAHYELGFVYRHNGDISRAQAELEQAVKFDPQDKEARYTLAALLKSGGDVQAAQAQFAQVQQLNQQEVSRDLALGANRAGAVMAEKKDWDGAIEQFRRALQLKPDLAEARFNLAGVSIKRWFGRVKTESLFRCGFGFLEMTGFVEDP